MHVVENPNKLGMAHIYGFHEDYFNNLREYTTRGPIKLRGLIKTNLDKLLQITLIPSQINKAKWILPILKEEGFKLVFSHINPNTDQNVRMFLRDPDAENNVDTLPYRSEWESPPEMDNNNNNRFVAGHRGGCCGYSDVSGLALNNREYNSYLEKLVKVAGEMKIYYRPGIAFQALLPHSLFNPDIYNIAWSYLQMIPFNPVHTYFSPQHKTKMTLFICCEGGASKSVEGWEVLYKMFKIVQPETTSVEKKPKTPVRDEKGRFAYNAGLGSMIAVNKIVPGESSIVRGSF